MVIYYCIIPYSAKFWWWKILADLADLAKIFLAKFLNMTMYTIRDKPVVLDSPNFSLPIACLVTNHQKVTPPKFCAIWYIRYKHVSSYIFVDEVLGLKNSNRYVHNGVEHNKKVNGVSKVMQPSSDSLTIECKHVTEVMARITDTVSNSTGVNSSAATTVNLSVVQEVTIVKQQEDQADDGVDNEVDDNTEDDQSTKLTPLAEEHTA